MTKTLPGSACGGPSHSKSVFQTSSGYLIDSGTFYRRKVLGSEEAGLIWAGLVILTAQAAAPIVPVVVVGEPAAAGWIPVLADCLEENAPGRYPIQQRLGVPPSPVDPALPPGVLVVAGPADFVGWQATTELPTIGVLDRSMSLPAGMLAVEWRAPSVGATLPEIQALLGARVCTAVLSVPVAHD